MHASYHPLSQKTLNTIPASRSFFSDNKLRYSRWIRWTFGGLVVFLLIANLTLLSWQYFLTAANHFPSDFGQFT